MQMTSSERFRALLSGKPIDRLPAIEWIWWWHLTLNRWLEEGLPRDCTGQTEVQNYFGLDMSFQHYISQKTAETPQPPSYGLGVMENEEDYEKKILPTLYPDPKTLFTDSQFEFCSRTREQEDMLHSLVLDGFFWFPRTLFGIENHFYSFYDEPDLYKRICDDYSDWLIRLCHFIFPRFRFDYMHFGEDMSYNNGPMLSKAQFDEFLAPFYRKVIPVIHSYDIPVFVDSDGDITEAVDWYASVGVDGMLPLERQAGVDVSLYLDKQPQMAFLGHFNKMCMKDGEEAMRAEFERLLPSMQRGKFIPSVDHQTPPDVSIENYRIYVRLLKEYTSRVTHSEGGLLSCPVYAEKK